MENFDDFVRAGNLLKNEQDEEATQLCKTLINKIEAHPKYEYKGRVFYNKSEYDMHVGRDEFHKEVNKKVRRDLILILGSILLFAGLVFACLMLSTFMP